MNLRGRRPRTLAVWGVKLTDDVGDASVPFPFDMETVPGFLDNRRGDNIALYDIPGPAAGWIESAPVST